VTVKGSKLMRFIQDAANVGRILIALAEKDVLLEPNARLPHGNNSKKWVWMGEPGEVRWEKWMGMPGAGAEDTGDAGGGGVGGGETGEK
jgi:hypothetical protein